MKIIVTGGAGFIGSALCRLLVGETGHEVVVVDKLTYAANLTSLAPVAGSNRYTFVAGRHLRPAADGCAACRAPARRDHASGRRKPRRPLDHRLGCVHPDQHQSARSRCWRRRGPIGRNCPRARRQRSASCMSRPTRSMARSAPRACFREDTPYDPSSPYSASKAASDHLAMAWHRTYGLPVADLQLLQQLRAVSFSREADPADHSQCARGKPLPVYGDGSNVRDWLYVEDHARALLAIMQNVGGRARPTTSARAPSAPTSPSSSASAIRSTGCGPGPSPRRSLITFVADRPGHDHRYAIDPAKARARDRLARERRLRGGHRADGGVVSRQSRAGGSRCAPRSTLASGWGS